jgi:type VI secretion system protein ImpH
MARTNGQSSALIKEDLLAHGQRFSFFQALRLLHQLNRLSSKPGSTVDIKPELSLSFPASDVARIDELPEGRGFSLIATFLGLYGVSSPLPAFYTEDLFSDARDDSSVAKDFIDILHRRLYQLLYESWKKYRLFIQVTEDHNHAHLAMLYAISGLSGMPLTEDDEEIYALLRYTSLFGGHPRSALALKTLLADAMRDVPVTIVPCVPRPVKIPPEQQLRLGSDEFVLGKNSFLGKELIDAQSKFRVRLGPLTQQRFRSMLEGGEEQKRLSRLIDRFLTDPLDYDYELIVAEGQTRNTCLGSSEWSRLGLDTVLFTGSFPGELNVVFPAMIATAVN